MVRQEANAEETFKRLLEDVVAVSENLANYCETVEEMIGICKHALENPGQLRLLLDGVTAAKKK